MEKRNIGKSGLSAPFLGLGTWAIGGGSWWGDNDDALSVKAIETAVEQGITWIDTAPIYGLYHSEEVVGEALRHIDRDKVILSTKCGLEWRHESPVLHKVVDGVQTYRDLSAKSIIEDVEDSLRRLGTDHLDVLYTHWQTPDLSIFPLEETVEAMMKLKEQGKIRAIGASNTTAEFIRGYCKYGQLDVIQEKYSLLTRRIEKQLLPTCKDEGSTRNTNPCFQPARRIQAIRLLDSWSDLCEKYHCTKAQLVIALTARMIPGLHVLCGARTPEQAIDNAGALHITLEGADAVQMKWDVDAIS
ncbi:MAG: aldo/keto reductase [Faecalibacterium prausnitzii]|uniref:Aldo/keto reductase n=1 Tax=Faecalibacterium prausnitzii TaxID=853 RepID=A0A943FY20_9FIRM|nr:aldo/keto reductase [Faecalibacterium prausnitzii]